MYSSSRPAAAVTVQLLFWTHFLREHKGTVLTKRNDLHQLAGCALIHTENHVKWEIARESSARRSTATVSVWVSGFGATQKQSLETVCRNKRFISVAWEGPITHIHTCTHTHTLYIFLNTTKTVQTLTQTGPHIWSRLKVVCTLKSRVITEDSNIDNVKVYKSDLFILKSESYRTTFNTTCTQWSFVLPRVRQKLQLHLRFHLKRGRWVTLPARRSASGTGWMSLKGDCRFLLHLFKQTEMRNLHFRGRGIRGLVLQFDRMHDLISLQTLVVKISIKIELTLLFQISLIYCFSKRQQYFIK